jgi:hypothetical protein
MTKADSKNPALFALMILRFYGRYLQKLTHLCGSLRLLSEICQFLQNCAQSRRKNSTPDRAARGALGIGPALVDVLTQTIRKTTVYRMP